MWLWLPKKYINAGTSEYVQGVEVAMDYSGEIPEGFDIIELHPVKSIWQFQFVNIEKLNLEMKSNT